jgi:RNA polymerase sigma-70 factor, ECF subfamily
MVERQPAEREQIELLRRIAAEDRLALEEFYVQTASALFAFALRLLGNSHDAEEATQDVFVQIWNKAQTFDPAKGVPLHWAMSIARNRCIDRLRVRQRRAQVIVEVAGGDGVEPQVEPESDPPILAEHELAAVRSAVDNLPPEQRQAIELAFFGGLTHQEIAASLNEPLGTIKARIRRGMMKLRENLEAYV